MSYRNKEENKKNRFNFQLAEEHDGKGILSVIENTNFKGKVALLYTRRPDALKSLKSDSDHVDVIVCKDKKEDKVIGFGACSVNELFINGNPTKTGYLFGLRGLPGYSKRYLLLHKGYRYLNELYQNKDIPIFITTILEENIYIQKMLGKKRKFMPDYNKIGAYNVYTLKPKKKKRHTPAFRRATKEDIPAIVDFLNERGKHYHFFPVLKKEDFLNGKFRNLNCDDFYILFSDDKKEILATGALWKQNEYKQYIVMRYGGIFKLIQPLSFIFKLLSYPSLPKVGEALDFNTLSFWGVKGNDKDIFKCFIENISSYAGENSEMLTIGIADGNPLNDVIGAYRHFKYRSVIYVVDWEKEGKYKQMLNTDKAIYLECGLL